MAKYNLTSDQQAFLNSFTLNVVDKTGVYNRLDKALPVYLKEITANDYEIIMKSGGIVTIDEKSGQKSLDLSTMKGGDSLLVSLCYSSSPDGNTLVFKGEHGKKLLGSVPTSILKEMARDIRIISGLITEDGEIKDPLEEAKKN